MCPGDPLGNHGQRPIPLTVIVPVLAHENGMGVTPPLPHQPRAGLRHYGGIERTRAFFELSAKIRRRRCRARLGPPRARCCSS